MRNFTTLPKPLVIFGNGCTIEIASKLSALGKKSVFIAYGSSIKKHGLVQPLIEECSNRKLEVFLFEGIVPESPDYVVRTLAAEIAACKPDAVVAFGGGSSIDTTRTAFILSGDVDNINAYLSGEAQISPEAVPSSLFICVPTTAGTGAEMSFGGPILSSESNRKGAVGVVPCLANFVYLDPELTTGLSPRLTFTTAMDALAHSIEGMTGKTRSHRSDMLCGQAVEYIWRSLPKALDNPTDLDARGELLIAANLAIAAETLRHIGHAICQPVGARFGIAHGETCALVLPGVLRFLADTGEIASEIRLILGKAGISAQSEKDGLLKMARQIDHMNRIYGVPSLEERGIAWEDVLELVPEIVGDARLIPNAPRDVNEKCVEQLLYEMHSYL